MRHCNVSAGREVRPALCFFGLIRNIRLTIDNVRTNLVRPIVRAAGAVDVFVHSLATRRERALLLDPAGADVRRLAPCRSKVESQASVDAAERLAGVAAEAFRRIAFRTQAMKRADEFPLPTYYTEAALRNWLRSRYSLMGVARLVEAQEREQGWGYTHVIVSRPDVRISPLRWDPGSVRPGTAYVPNFHHCTGINDRFAHGSRSTMLRFMRQYADLRGSNAAVDFSPSMRTTEAHLCHHAIRSGIQVRLTPLCVTRVRADGGYSLMDGSRVAHAPYECAAKGLDFRAGEDDFEPVCTHASRTTWATIEDRFRTNVSCRPIGELPFPHDVVVEARKASARCKVVVFTTALFPSDARVAPPRDRPPACTPRQCDDRGVCYVAFVSDEAHRSLPPSAFGR